MSSGLSGKSVSTKKVESGRRRLMACAECAHLNIYVHTHTTLGLVLNGTSVFYFMFMSFACVYVHTPHVEPDTLGGQRNTATPLGLEL